MYHLWPPLDYKPYVGRLSVSYTWQGEQLAECLEHGGQEHWFTDQVQDSQRSAVLFTEDHNRRQRINFCGERLWRKKKIKEKKNRSHSTIQFSSVQFSCSVVSNSLRPHEPQHARSPCPSPTPGVYSNPCPLSHWCHPAISSSVVPFSSCPQSLPASGSFPMSQLFSSGGQRIGVSASTSVLPVNTQDCSSSGWTGWISLQSRGSQESPWTPHFKSINSSALSFLSQSNSHIHT